MWDVARRTSIGLVLTVAYAAFVVALWSVVVSLIADGRTCKLTCTESGPHWLDALTWSAVAIVAAGTAFGVMRRSAR